MLRILFAVVCVGGLSVGCTNEYKIDFDKSRSSVYACIDKYGFDNDHVLVEDFKNLSESFYEKCRSNPLTDESTLKAIEIFSECRKYDFEDCAKEFHQPLICRENVEVVLKTNGIINRLINHNDRMFDIKRRLEKYKLPMDPESVARRKK